MKNTKPEIKLPGHYRQIVEQLVDQAKKNLAINGEANPVSCVVNLQNEQSEILNLNFESPQNKARSIAMIKHVAGEIDADLVIMMVEAWSLPPHLSGQYEEILAKYGAISKCPDRIDILSISVEAHDGFWMGSAEIQDGLVPSVKKRIGTPAFIFATEAAGRLVGLLPPKDSYPQGPLH